MYNNGFFCLLPNPEKAAVTEVTRQINDFLKNLL